MRVLLDTNVILSAILFGGVPRQLLLAAVEGRITLVTSPFILDELEELLEKRFGFSRAAATETRAELETLADLARPVHIPSICRDPDDDNVLAAAVSGDTVAIVTGDKDLLDLVSYEGIEIVAPATFLKPLSGD